MIAVIPVHAIWYLYLKDNEIVSAVLRPSDNAQRFSGSYALTVWGRAVRGGTALTSCGHDLLFIQK